MIEIKYVEIRDLLEGGIFRAVPRTERSYVSSMIIVKYVLPINQVKIKKKETRQDKPLANFEIL